MSNRYVWRLGLACWVGVVVGAVLIWPSGRHPAGCWLLLVALAALPVAWIEGSGKAATCARGLARYRRALLAAAIAAGLALALRYAVRVEPFIEGIDFYTYVLYARDIANGASDVPAGRYIYLPGVYTFWRLALWLGDGTVTGVQWPYLGLLGLNAALIGAIVWRLARNIGAAFLGGFWYVLACGVFEGFLGITEPLCTAPVLAGLLAWNGRPLRGGSGWLRTLALAAGFGLALYAKQQGGILAVGALALLVYNLLAPRDARHEYVQLLALPVLSALVFTIAMLGEGEGLTPFRVAYERTPQQMVAYAPPEVSFPAHVAMIARAAGTLAAGAVLAALVWLGAALVPRWREVFLQPWCQMAGFSVVATAATLVQYTERHYHHYFLQGAPMAIVATVLAALALARALPAAVRASPLLLTLAGGVAALPLLAGFDRGYSPFEWDAPVPDGEWRHKPETARDLEFLRTILRPGEDVLVLPPRRNEVHMVTGSRSISYEGGYNYLPSPDILLRAIRSPRLEAVVVVKELDWVNAMVWKQLDCDEAVKALPPAGFVVTHDLASMTVWQRRHAPPDAPGTR